MHPLASAAAPARSCEGRIEAALSLRSQGRLTEALQELSGAGEFSPDLYTLRGDLQLALGQLHEAVGSYSTVIAIESGNLYAHSRLAHCLHRFQRWEAAAEAYRKIVDSTHHRDEACLGLGDCLLHLNRAEEALDCFDACWSESARWQARFGTAVALQLLRRFDEAEAAYAGVLTLDPKCEEAYSNLVALNIDRTDLVRARLYALRLFELNPQSPIALQALVLAALERADDESAACCFTRLLELSPGGQLPHNTGAGNVAEYRLGDAVLKRLHPAGRHLKQHAGKE